MPLRNMIYQKYTPKQIKKKINKTSKKWLEAEAWRLFSLLVRQSEADDNGYCRCADGCGSIGFWRDFDAGHFVSSTKAATKFDRINVHAQNRNCNRFGEGKKRDYGRNLDKLFGEGVAEKLEAKAKMYCKRSASDYRYMIAEYLQELNKKGYLIK
jgi:hypothetical protein